jgi:general L-amino acid transport system substrate-binding protein
LAGSEATQPVEVNFHSWFSFVRRIIIRLLLLSLPLLMVVDPRVQAAPGDTLLRPKRAGSCAAGLAKA